MSGGQPEVPVDGLPVAVFGFDIAEAAQIRRIRSLIALGCKVTSFCQRREGGADFTPEWHNVDLGLVRHKDIRGRALGAVSAVGRAMRGWRQLADAQMVLARNLDLALIALAARRLAALRAGRSAAPLVYECLDIHDLMTRPDRVGGVMRRAERHVLSQSALLVVSSPGFVQNYFAPVQDYIGPTALVENKLWLGLEPGLRPARPTPAERPADAPLTIGLVGSIRCQASVELLMRTADLMGDRLRVRISGALHEHSLSGFHEALAARGNVEWTGPYAYPQGLAQAYAGCDLVWAQDMWQRGTNSDWLLPNRIYEASWCGCPSVGLADTQTGARIASDGLGWTIARPAPDHLAALLDRLTPAQLARQRGALLARPECDFVQDARDVLPILAPALSRLAGRGPLLPGEARQVAG
ncbi:glycosyl transferase [Paracoccus lutimaris]|uniref:Succinoglycan biosynthesis protein ExoL n=1 Tax=Paracoccus lutimaris TaxID=1490030 RepID=A0A368YHD7_9RHOB|nr:glycosyl transferase [Paracoccus lutimaris]RCW79643.1 succinoglycan biosynthesis protein ExoL [Paracoccus lutimaris]